MWRRAVVRLHGYNQEIEVQQAELELSLGQEAINLQIEQAGEDLVSYLYGIPCAYFVLYFLGLYFKN